MKLFILLALLSTATTALADVAACSFQDIQLLRSAKGRQSAKVNELLNLESPNFSCLIKTEHFAFIEVCGTFTYVQHTYQIINAAQKLTAVVKDGGISCTDIEKTDLVKARFTNI